MTRQRAMMRLRGRATIGVAAVATIWPAMSAGSALVVRHDVPNPDAFISLGSHEWERLPAVARLARTASDAVVLLTQPVKPTPANCHRCAERVGWLRSLGIPSERLLILPRKVGNTRDEAIAVAEHARTSRIRRLMIVTSPYHARRALAVFESVLGPQVVVGLHPATEDSPARPARWWMGPYDRAYVAYEWAALAWYGLRYGIHPVVAGTPAAGEVFR